MKPKKPNPTRKPDTAKNWIHATQTVNSSNARISPPAATRAITPTISQADQQPPVLKPLLTMKAIRNPPSHNYYGFERIHILQYNYDGEGNALIRFNNEKDLNTFGRVDLNMILLGDPGSGDRWYRPEEAVKKRKRSRAGASERRRP